MKVKMIITLIFLIINVGFAFSGDKNPNAKKYTGFIIGLSFTHVKEKVLNNIRHKGTFFPSPITFIYENVKINSVQVFEFNIHFTGLKSRYDPDVSSLMIHPDINYRYLWKINKTDEKLDLYLGGITGLNMHLGWYDNWDDSHLYWLTSYYIGADGRLHYELTKKSSFYLDLHFPVISLVSRPPERFLYKGVNPEFGWMISELHDNLRLTTLHQHFTMNLDLAYELYYSEKSKLRIFWRLYYLNNKMNYSKNLRVISNVIGAGLLF